MPKRRLRPLTPELLRRMKLSDELNRLQITKADLSRKSGIDASIFTRFLKNDIGESDAEDVILRAIEEGRKRQKARKPTPLVYV